MGCETGTPAGPQYLWQNTVAYDLVSPVVKINSARTQRPVGAAFLRPAQNLGNPLINLGVQGFIGQLFRLCSHRLAAQHVGNGGGQQLLYRQAALSATLPMTVTTASWNSSKRTIDFLCCFQIESM